MKEPCPWSAWGALLRKGYSIRDVAKLCSKGVSTVQRVKCRLNLW